MKKILLFIGIVTVFCVTSCAKKDTSTPQPNNQVATTPTPTVTPTITPVDTTKLVNRNWTDTLATVIIFKSQPLPNGSCGSFFSRVHNLSDPTWYKTGTEQYDGWWELNTTMSNGIILHYSSTGNSKPITITTLNDSILAYTATNGSIAMTDVLMNVQ